MSGKIMQLNGDLIKNNLKNLVGNGVEETLNALLDCGADELANAEKHERSGERKGCRSGHYDRNFSTASGDVTLHIPKLKGVQFETAIIERYKRRECSVEEASIEMYLAGVPVRRVEDIAEALWGTRVSPGTIGNLNKKAYGHIETWRTRPLARECPYVYVDGVFPKRSWGGGVQNVSVLAAIGVGKDGYREIIGACGGMKEDKESWKSFFVHPRERGLSGVRLAIGDKGMGMPQSLEEVHPDAKCQRCTVHFHRNVFPATPRKLVREAGLMLKAIHAQENKAAAREKAALAVKRLKEMKLQTAAKKVEEGIGETLAHMHFPSRHRTRIRTNNAIERVNREIKRRTKAIGAFPDGQGALMLACARLGHVAASGWGTKKHLNMQHSYDMNLQEKAEQEAAG